MRIFTYPRHLGVILLLLYALLGSFSAAAQSALGGKVVDQSGQPVAGAVVSVDGTFSGTVTDAEGAFELKVAEGTPITVQFSGYTNANVALKGGMIVTLEESVMNIDEVVVVGYGTVKKESLTGAVATIASEKFEDKGGLSNPVQALQGQVPGVMITRSSSAPGQESWDMQLRGRSSTNTAEPMVVIDGVTYNSISDLGMLNYDDIESMNFLKDGSAAIYGSRAANGVVLITTKKGAAGKTTVQYNGSMTIKTPGIMTDWCNMQQWAEGMATSMENANYTEKNMYDMALQMQKYSGYWVNYNEQARTLRNGMAGKKDMPYDPNGDLMNDLFWNAISQEHSLSVSGGNDRSSYRVSLGYNYDDSNLKWGNNSNQRYNIRLNNTMKLSDRITLESSISYNRTELVQPTNQTRLSPGNFSQPGLPAWTPSGLPYAFENAESVPGGLEFGGDTRKSNRQVNISEALNIDILDCLDFNVTGGYNSSNNMIHEVLNSVDYYNFQEDLVFTEPTQAKSYFKSTTAKKDYYTSSGYFSFNEEYGKHTVAATLGGSYEYTEYEGFGLKITDTDPNIGVVNGNGDWTREGVNYWETALASSFARLNYDFDSRYLFEANMRYDGSSKFAPGNRWNFFWGASGGWRISNEEFMKDITWLNELKLRGSYSEMGNQDGIGNYDGVQLYSMALNSGAYIGDDLLSYMSTKTLASSTRTWERIKSWNVGFDVNVHGFTASFDYWHKYNGNMLIGITYPNTLGIETPDTNEGQFKSWGYEGALQYRGRAGEFSYSAGVNASFSRNEIIDNGTDVDLWTSGYKSDREGYGLNGLMGYEMYGRAQSDEEAQAYYDKYSAGNTLKMPTKDKWKTGMNMYKDQNGDGILDESDLIYLGSQNPEISYSFNANVAWKGIEISAVFQGVGNRVMYYGESYLTSPFRSIFYNSTSAYIGNTWSPDNQEGWFNPLITNYGSGSGVNNWNYGVPSTHTALNGNYLRLKNLTIAYSLPKSLMEKVRGLSAVRVYATGTDLWEHHNLPINVDPEASVSSFKGANYYPFTRNWIVGIGVTF